MSHRTIYEGIGTHEGVRSEINEDLALGQKTKDMKYNLKIVRGEHLIQAGLGGNGSVWDGLNRLTIPTFLKQKKLIVGLFMMSFFYCCFHFSLLYILLYLF